MGLLLQCLGGAHLRAEELTASASSLVVLGDSVAAGEGINYGYSYDQHSILGARWVGGVEQPQWQGDYQKCHQSKQAYGEIIADELGMSLAKFACTGATYVNGFIGQRHVKQTVYRPAEFGDWQNQQQLNPEYDRADPDVVILTFGADDVNFVDIVTYCVLGFYHDDLAALHQVMNQVEHKVERSDLLRNKIKQRYAKKGTLLSSLQTDQALSDVCTAENPGDTIESLFWALINDGTLTQHYVAMVNAIKARGKKAGKDVKIVFTTYHNPLPAADESMDCHDVLDLTRAEINYLNFLMDTLNNTIIEAVGGMDGVAVADISSVMDGHHWCSDDPWVYGLSILYLNHKSQAPFHPTPAGQQAIADIVKQKVAAFITP